MRKRDSRGGLRQGMGIRKKSDLNRDFAIDRDQETCSIPKEKNRQKLDSLSKAEIAPCTQGVSPKGGGHTAAHINAHRDIA